MKSLRERLTEYEARLESTPDGLWEHSTWPDRSSEPQGMFIERLTQPLENGDIFMLHRFMPDTGEGYVHGHPYAVASDVLGPGTYEVGFIVGGACHSRVVCTGPFYYEMRTQEVQHAVRPLSGPIFSVAIWSPFPPRAALPPVSYAPLREQSDSLLEHVRRTFDRLCGPVKPPRT